MEKEERNIPRITNSPPVESEFLLRWGSTKRLRCARLRGNNNPAEISSSSVIRSRFLALEAPFPQSASLHTRLNSEMAIIGSEENGKITRVDTVAGDQGVDHHEKKSNNGGMKFEWPKLCIGLSSKEKEEDFMAMKGCKLPQRPKKRAKIIQRTLLLASPGTWLTDMSLERYQVREKKKTCKKRARGLKAMGSNSIIDSDSE